MPDKKIRLLRVLEYEYENHEAMIKDMGHWSLGAQGIKDTGPTRVTSSTMFPREVVLDVADWAEVFRSRARREHQENWGELREFLRTLSRGNFTPSLQDQARKLLGELNA
ncbi:MAG TPA: hypothetical protein VJ837_06185 [Candidatus Paceibacterota bacterium]|nr:hypothetical protein [Candidatus Paceibacterota bacterium]